MQSDLEALRDTDFFADLPDEHLARLAMRVQHRRYDEGATIFEDGDPGNALLLIVDGAVKITMLSPTRQEITLALLNAGDAFGELCLLDGMPRSATAKTLAPTRCLVLYRDDFLELVESEPTAIRAVLRSLATIIRRMNEKLGDVAMLDVHGRLNKALLLLARDHGRQTEDGIYITRPVTVSDLASLAGMYPVEVERLMRGYQLEDIVRVERDQLLLRRPEALRVAP